MAEPTRAAELRHRHHDGSGDRGRPRRRALCQDVLDALVGHGLPRPRPAYAYAFFSSLSAHFTPSSGFMPLMAWAYMSTRMYLTRASDAFRLGVPGYPAQRPYFDDSLNGTSLGSRSHTA